MTSNFFDNFFIKLLKKVPQNLTVLKFTFFILIYLNIFQWIITCLFVDAQLIINIRNGGGEVFQEAISANTTEDVIEVEYQNTDGSLVTQLIDFRNNLQIFRLIILGEQERGDSQKYQRLCYVTLLNRTEYISSDNISKLRQRNPSSIREAELDKGKQVYYMNIELNEKQSDQLSNHINRLCSSKNGQLKAKIFARIIDVKNILQLNEDINLNEKYIEKIEKNRCSMQKFKNSIALKNLIIEDDFERLKKNKFNKPILMSSNLTPKSLNDFSSYWQEKNLKKKSSDTQENKNLESCYCKIEICIPWYPCTIKYCKNDENNSKDTRVRCGIKSCKKCWLFYFNADNKQACLWDE